MTHRPDILHAAVRSPLASLLLAVCVLLTTAACADDPDARGDSGVVTVTDTGEDVADASNDSNSVDVRRVCDAGHECAEPGARCFGNDLITCERDSRGCRVERLRDCAAENGSCDDTVGAAGCVTPCVDEPNCIGEPVGTPFCAQDEAVLCFTEGECLVELRKSCGPDWGCYWEPDVGTYCASLDDTAESVVVYDTSDGAGSCADNLPDPGSDLMFVELRGPEGETLGWGATVASGVQDSDNDFADPMVLNGAAPTLGADECTDAYQPNTVVSLGCGGWVAVQFLDDNGMIVPVTSGDVVVVGEHDSQCEATMTTDDSYELRGCNVESPSRPGDCAWTLGTGSGEVEVEFSP